MDSLQLLSFTTEQMACNVTIEDISLLSWSVYGLSVPLTSANVEDNEEDLNVNMQDCLPRLKGKKHFQSPEQEDNVQK